MNHAMIRITGFAPQPLPALGHGLWVDHLDDGAQASWLASQLAPQHLDLLADLRLPGSHQRLQQGLAICALCGAQAWLLVIIGDNEGEAQLHALAASLSHAAVQPSGVLVTPAAYLESYQPSGPWPSGLTPNQALLLARAALPGVPIGAGVPTYFTELNRCRPAPGTFDYLTHATSPTVHAADDVSVMETLQALPDIVRSAQTLAAGQPYRITTSAIGAWRNPYGGQLTPNPDRQRLTLSDRDPRQHGLLAAAWTVGHYAAMHRGGVQATALWALNPPFAIADEGRYWPVFHVLRALAGGHGQRALALDCSGPGAAAVGWLQQENNLARVCVANLTAQPLTLGFAGLVPHAAAVLGPLAFHQALEEPGFMDHREAVPRVLEPFTCAVIDCSLDVEPASKWC
ncbi:hypothetical protein [Pseudomonas japonica]|uniref:hypothetical protein n=1 Tax=Pseudomonas japonica TaxID=256466 RepID=UPI0015E407E4|nr:hypothetical protein [Pseudomonas japonica]MBA1291139.1 hypothetical protein [Pseudomonas japonica]